MSNQELAIADVIRAYRGKEWGFTGTRAGMSTTQHGWCRKLLDKGHPSVFRHGGAFGADTQVHAIWKELKLSGHADVWPADDKRRALFLNQPRVTVKDVMNPLTRNEEIVSRVGFLVAAPHTQGEVQRSGTWHTIRFAIRNEVPTLILWPDGKLTLHRDKILHRVV
jgi:hypothetical protein